MSLRSERTLPNFSFWGHVVDLYLDIIWGQGDKAGADELAD